MINNSKLIPILKTRHAFSIAGTLAIIIFGYLDANSELPVYKKIENVYKFIYYISSPDEKLEQNEIIHVRNSILANDMMFEMEEREMYGLYDNVERAFEYIVEKDKQIRHQYQLLNSSNRIREDKKRLIIAYKRLKQSVKELLDYIANVKYTKNMSKEMWHQILLIIKMQYSLQSSLSKTIKRYERQKNWNVFLSRFLH